MKTKLKALGKAQKTTRPTHATLWAPDEAWASQPGAIRRGRGRWDPRRMQHWLPRDSQSSVPFTEPYTGNFGESTVAAAYAAKTTPESKTGSLCQGPGAARKDGRWARPGWLRGLSAAPCTQSCRSVPGQGRDPCSSLTHVSLSLPLCLPLFLKKISKNFFFLR